MNGSEFWEPSVRAYLGYFFSFCLRYFACAGGLYWLFHLASRQKWLVYRIQQHFPSFEEVAYEIRWSLLNTACSGVSTVLTFQLVRTGHTSMYFNIADYGWLYFAVSVTLCIVGFDTWIYWQHRLLHTPWLFRHVHSVHHRLGNPTPFATFAQHPVETFMGNGYFVLFVVFVPSHVLALSAAGLFMFVYGIIGHLDYEFYPRGFTRHRLFGWLNTATYHNMHHSLRGYNYSTWFLYWDRLMGTDHPAYHETFDAIKGRVEAGRAATAVGMERQDAVRRAA
jgi:lathosterol oxidase